MGSEVFVYLVDGDHEYLTRVDARDKSRLGESVQLGHVENKLHPFDVETGKAITCWQHTSQSDWGRMAQPHCPLVFSILGRDAVK